MKLLFDENLSPKLVGLVTDHYPASAHVRDVDLRGSSDRRIWDYARQNGFVIVSKDDDFRQRSFLHGAPPKVIWLQVGNAGTAPVADLLRQQQDRLHQFENEEEASFLILTRRGDS